MKKELTPREVMLLSTLITQILVEPNALKFMVADPTGTLTRAGFTDKEIPEVVEYLQGLQEVLQGATSSGANFWIR
jgi:hypothetical protein